MITSFAIAMALTVAQGTGLPPTSYHQPPPEMKDTHTLETQRVEHPNGIHGWVSYGTIARGIRIYWSKEAVGQPLPLDEIQTIPLSFWPTSCRVLNNDTICIAGRDQNAYTIVEVITITDATIMQVSDGNGGLVDAIQPARVAQTRRPVQIREVGKDGISKMLIDPAAPASSVLVQFFDSKDVYKVGLGQGLITPAVSAISFPALTNWHDLAYSGEHPSLGYLYVFENLFILDPTVPSATQNTDIAVLQDANKDGIIEDAYVIDQAQRQTISLGSPSAWVSFYE